MVSWKARDGAFTCWMGIPPDRDGEREGRPFWHRPHEPIDDGCPAGWYRCPFAESLYRYFPTPAGDTYMESPLLREAPSLVVEAVQQYQRERARVRDLYMEVMRDG